MLTFHPLTNERWPDFENLFGPRGACGGCWCMYWRQSRSQFSQLHGEPNHLAMKALVDSGTIPGLMAYEGAMPIAWCSIAPRTDFPSLERSRILRPLDDQPVWSVVCFYVARAQRRQGLTVQLLKAGIELAASRGAVIVEGYPVIPKKEKAPDVFLYTGLSSAFAQAGFKEVIRRSPTRPIMRYYISTEQNNADALFLGKQR